MALPILHQNKKPIVILEFGLFVILAGLIVALIYVSLNRQVDAASTKNFDPGTLISQSNFTNNKSMSASQIQNFLNKKNSTCLQNYKGLALVDANKNGQIEDWTKSERYGGSTGKQQMSAAQLIKAAADTYGINPQVLLVTLEKEQGLVTRSDCPTWRYNTAFGFGCPDTAACDKAAYGFTRQLDNAAYHFKNYMTGEDVFGNIVYSTFKPGKRSVLFHPNSSCGSSSVDITNEATAALYTYTPYQPNRASLNAGYGTGDGCSSYGNRNFHLFYTDWFGTPHNINFQPMKIPRNLQATEDLSKTYLRTMQESGERIEEGEVIAFDTSANINGVLYLRTSRDTKADMDYGIPYRLLKNAPTISYEKLSTPITFTSTANLKKTSLYNAVNDGTSIRKGQKIKFDSYTTIDDTRYYRTQHDTKADMDYGIPAENLRANFTIKSMKIPRQLQVTTAQSKTSLYNMLQNGTKLTKGQVISFNKLVTIGDVMYLITNRDSRYGDAYGVPYSDLKTVPSFKFSSMKYPRKMKATKSLSKTSLYTMKQDGTNIDKGQAMSLTTMIVVDGIRYLRTSHDSKLGIAYVIPYSELRDI